MGTEKGDRDAKPSHDNVPLSETNGEPDPTQAEKWKKMREGVEGLGKPPEPDTLTDGAVDYNASKLLGPNRPK